MENMIINKFGNVSVSAITGPNDNIWFIGNDVARALGYKNFRKAVHTIVKNTEKITMNLRTQNRYAGLRHQMRKITLINEPGLYRLIFSSKLPSAEKFKTWIFTEILPALRKNTILNYKFSNCKNETDLHYNVIDYIRNFHNNVKIIPGLGELQDATWKRLSAYKKGYSSGQPDIIIPLTTSHYNGLAIELKNPISKSKPSKKQIEFLKYLSETCKYLVVVSYDYKEIKKTIFNYMSEVRLSCQSCKKYYIIEKCLINHNRKYHSFSLSHFL